MQKLTIKGDFYKQSSLDKYKLLHETELRVQRLERLIDSMRVWKKGSLPYQKAEEEFVEYMSEIHGLKE
jgi:hypothetical protein